MADVLVVGAGPVGLTMACELARHGVSCRIVDRLSRPSPYCRAIGVTPRTLEVWEDMGIAREMIDAGLWLTGMRSVVHGFPAHQERIEFPELPYAPLGIPQYETERVLARHLGRLGISIERGVTLAALAQSADGVAVRLLNAGGDTEHAAFRYVIGCDGAHSTVRHALGIAFEGDAFPMMFMLGDVHVAWDLPRGIALRALRLKENDAPDMFIAIPLPEPGRYRVSTLAPSDGAGEGGSDHGIQAESRGPTLPELQAIADDLLPEAPRLSDLRWSSLFRISMRLAERYRQGRVFIAGDAAHIHPPTGGQGMNTGIQDAYNLAWKLALVQCGAAPEALLDSYEAERRPVGAEVVARTRAASENYGREQGQDRLADTQILVSYRGTPWVGANRGVGALSAGDRAPDAQGLRRQGVGFPIRLFEILRGTEHVLLAPCDVPGSADSLAAFAREVAARTGGHLRVVGISSARPAGQPGMPIYHDEQGSFAGAYGPGATMLIRPDGHIGWVGETWRDPGLRAYLDRVFT
jgi:2-polyprenyl-6-methoxyphenol hydroxylase-like FAD-dependent oxidoreductase